MAASAPVASNVLRRAWKGAERWPHMTPVLNKLMENNQSIKISSDHEQPLGSWSTDQIRNAASSSVMLTWSPGVQKHDLPIITHGEGIYLYDNTGKKYIDWTSQAVCANLGYSVPNNVKEAVNYQMNTLPFLFGGLGMSEIRARLSRLMEEILPGDLSGVLFPSSGSEANEAAIMMARRYTGKYKVLSYYRSYHGSTGNALQATGDFRRSTFGGDHVPGFVKVFNPYPLYWEYAGDTQDEKCEMALNMLEEQILNEGPESVAVLTMEPVVGARGVLIPSVQYMQGVRAICDQYNILLHCDEVMAGFGRTGKLFAFQNFPGVVPDIITCAKGMSSSYLPVSMVACRKPIMDAFELKPLGWGSTYQAHPMALACAYENLKYFFRTDVLNHVQSLAPKFDDAMNAIADNHPSIKQYRAIGLFGCFDTQMPNGQCPNAQHADAFKRYGQAYHELGLMALARPPHIHVAPPLIISEEEMMDGMERQDQALYALDDALGF